MRLGLRSQNGALAQRLGHHLSLYNLSAPLSTNGKALLKPTGGPGEDASHSKWRTDGIGQIGDDAVISDGWDFSLSLFPSGRSQYTCAASQYRAKQIYLTIKTTRLLFLFFPFFFFFSCVASGFSPETQAAMHSNKSSSILTCALRFPLVASPPFQRLQPALLGCDAAA